MAPDGFIDLKVSMDQDSERPAILSETRDAVRLVELRRTAIVKDTIRAQLGELIETRNAHRKWTVAELDTEVHHRLGATPSAYGNWAFFPWSNRLVHVLPEVEYVELRTSRNKNKITREEQDVLGRAKCGVAGLSVGQATALTLALEGVGGTLRLADFDTLNLSNLNRLRAGVHEIGINKAVITARAIYELNPYANIEVFDDGITDDNIDRFLDSLDVLFEECDDLKMKVRLREEAKKRRIPVLMETSDRGMLDVERFDLEPTRPLFHGLAGDLNAAELASLTTYEKVPVVLAIIGARTMSPRLAGSLVDIDVTLKTWPQLASAVALGGAVNTDVARRVLLGRFTESGRYFVDVEQIVGTSGTDPPDELPERVATTPTRPPVPTSHALEQPSHEQLHKIVSFASMAPSGGNCQPWRFVYSARMRTLECWHVLERSTSFLDFESRAAYLAFGAAAENVRLACASLAIPCRLSAFPDASRPDLICKADLSGTGEPTAATLEDARLGEVLGQRVTNRRFGVRATLPVDASAALSDIAARANGRLRLLTEPTHLDRFADLHGETERLRILNPTMHQEMMHELRWSDHETTSTRDGIDLVTLELTATDRAAMEVLKRPRVAAMLLGISGGAGLKTPSRKAIAGSSAVGLVTTAGSSPEAYFRGGVAMQRVWLYAGSLGWAFQPMTAMLYVFARLEGGGSGLNAAEQRAYSRQYDAYRSLFELAPPETGVMAFRLAKADAPTARSLRRPISDTLTIID